jgi:hypothetical protein
MRSHVIVVAGSLAALMALASPAARADETGPAVGVRAQPLMNGDHMGRLREEVRLHEQRAREIEPILARDHQARHDVEADWVVLEKHARDLHARANDFRSYAGEVTGPAQNEMNGFATELDNFAAHDEENARLQHEIADKLERAIQNEIAMRDWHLKLAQRLREWLASNGG